MNTDDKKYAVLVDSDNISSRYLPCIIDEMTKYGTVTYKRVYGDWTSPQNAKWREELLENSFTPIQQFRNTVGKNATDSTLIIDAMDILYSDRVDGFCIVSSDGDFTRLAGRLRESGMDVIGMGESKTPRSFRAACSVFTDLEILYDSGNDNSNENISTGNSRKRNVVKQSKIENAIIEIITENDNRGRSTALGEIGSRLQKKYSDFDVRNYGYSSLSTFIGDMNSFTLRKRNSTFIVEMKEDDSARRELVNYIVKTAKSGGANGVDLGSLGQKLHKQFPKFKVREFGYATLGKFMSALPEVDIVDVDENHKNVVVKKEVQES
ncbi:MAG: NYN domain-containing protein [Lachnospiraceae bacterium]|jgi:uncharacterized LabA/DUF88 family protein